MAKCKVLIVSVVKGLTLTMIAYYRQCSEWLIALYILNCLTMRYVSS